MHDVSSINFDNVVVFSTDKSKSSSSFSSWNELRNVVYISNKCIFCEKMSAFKSIRCKSRTRSSNYSQIPYCKLEPQSNIHQKHAPINDGLDGISLWILQWMWIYFILVLFALQFLTLAPMRWPHLIPADSVIVLRMLLMVPIIGVMLLGALYWLMCYIGKVITRMYSVIVIRISLVVEDFSTVFKGKEVIGIQKIDSSPALNRKIYRTDKQCAKYRFNGKGIKRW